MHVTSHIYEDDWQFSGSASLVNESCKLDTPPSALIASQDLVTVMSSSSAQLQIPYQFFHTKTFESPSSCWTYDSHEP